MRSARNILVTALRKMPRSLFMAAPPPPEDVSTALSLAIKAFDEALMTLPVCPLCKATHAQCPGFPDHELNDRGQEWAAAFGSAYAIAIVNPIRILDDDGVLITQDQKRSNACSLAKEAADQAVLVLPTSLIEVER